MDRNAKFSDAFRATLEQAGVEPLRLPPRSPNLTPQIGRFLRSVKDECLHRMVFFGERAVRTAVVSFLGHHHQETFEYFDVRDFQVATGGAFRATNRGPVSSHLPAVNRSSFLGCLILLP